MKQFIITLAFVILAVFLVNSFVLGDTNSMKSEGTRLGNKMITDLKSITGN